MCFQSRRNARVQSAWCVSSTASAGKGKGPAALLQVKDRRRALFFKGHSRVTGKLASRGLCSMNLREVHDRWSKKRKALNAPEATTATSRQLKNHSVVGLSGAVTASRLLLYCAGEKLDLHVLNFLLLNLQRPSTCEKQA